MSFRVAVFICSLLTPRWVLHHQDYIFMNNNVFLIAASLLLITLLNAPKASAQDTSTTPSSSARVLTLDECLQIAMSNNIGLKQVRNNARIAKANDFQSIMNFLPSVSGYGNYGWNNGTSFDNSSGQFFTGSREGSYLAGSADLTLFNGFSAHYGKKANANLLEASLNTIKAEEQNIQSSVLGSYLAVVLDKESLKISNARIELLNGQLEREKKREEVGVGNLEQVYNFQSQLANESLNLVNLDNQYKRDLLGLLQTLGLKLGESYQVAQYIFEEDNILLNEHGFDQVLAQSMAFSPTLRSANASAEAAHYNFKVTQASMMPTLSIGADYSTQYSSLNRDVVSGDPIDLTQQYQNLTNKSLQLQLSVPIFNKYQNRTNTQIAKISRENAAMSLEQANIDVTNTIQRVFLELVSAQETYKAAQNNLIALNQSFEFVKTRYENGNTDFYTYLESLNNKNRAEIELVNSKYSIVFRKKILDVYRGLM